MIPYFGTHTPNEGLGSWPRRRAMLTGDRVAWSFEGAHTTYLEVEQRTRQLANALTDAGVRRGDRVAFLGFNHPALLEALFAASRIGAITVIINARLARAEVEYILEDSGASVLVFGAEQSALISALPQSTPVRLYLAVEGDSTVRAGIATPFEEFLRGGGSQDDVAEVHLDDPCLIMYTSGTTGRPKGALLSHGNMLSSCLNVVVASDVRPDEVCLAAAPLFHIAGLNGLLMPTFLKGGTILIHRGFDAERALDALRHDGVTSTFTVPAMLDAIAELPAFAAAEFPALRNLVVGGAPVPARVLRQWNAKGTDIQQGYGFTEAAPSVTLLDARDAVRKSGSAGRPQFFTDVRIVDHEGNDIRPGGTGEIVVRGPNVMREYWRNEDATADAFRDGWYLSGDIATIDVDGYISLLDRSKDLFISGGENVYPSEVESTLLDLPGVAEVAVIGVPDERWGEVGKAFIVRAAGSELTADDVMHGLASRLARYKQPKHIEFLDELPRTASGKVQKHELREAARTAAVDENEPRRTETTIAGLAELVGAELGVSELVEVTQDRIDQFADVTGDHQWIHTDPERAASGPFGGTIAHGYLSLSLVSALTQQVLTVTDARGAINYGVDRVRFPSPLRSGTKVRLRATLAAVDPIEGGVQVRLDSTVIPEGAEKPAASATQLVRFFADNETR